MARIRTIKPEIVEDEKTAALSDSAFRLFASMIFLADDHGNVRADSRWLQGQIWWAHGEPPRVAAILREVSDAGLIKVYEVRGGIYAHLLGWGKHQRIDNAGKPRVPLASEPDAKPFRFHDEPTMDSSRKSAANRREIPLDPDPDQYPEHDHEPEHAAPPAPLALSDSPGLAVVKRKVDTATGPHQSAIAEFTGYYQRAHGGASPTWNGRLGKLMSGLVKAHGLHEIVRRIHVLETAPPKWPLPPWDFHTFHTHFDKLATESNSAESAIDVAIRFSQGDFR